MKSQTSSGQVIQRHVHLTRTAEASSLRGPQADRHDREGRGRVETALRGTRIGVCVRACTRPDDGRVVKHVLACSCAHVGGEHIWGSPAKYRERFYGVRSWPRRPGRSTEPDGLYPIRPSLSLGPRYRAHRHDFAKGRSGGSFPPEYPPQRTRRCFTGGRTAIRLRHRGAWRLRNRHFDNTAGREKENYNKVSRGWHTFS